MKKRRTIRLLPTTATVNLRTGGIRCLISTYFSSELHRLAVYYEFRKSGSPVISIRQKHDQRPKCPRMGKAWSKCRRTLLRRLTNTVVREYRNLIYGCTRALL